MQPLDKQWLTAFAYMHYISNGEGNGIPLQYSCLENPMDGGAWWAAVHGVTKSWTRLSDFTFTFQFHALEKEMATHSSVLAWRTPGTGEPGGLLSMGLHRVGQDWSDSSSSSSNYISKPRKQGHRLPEYFLYHIKTQKAAQEINEDLWHDIISGIL